MDKQLNKTKKYCLDTNAFIEPWNKYYSIKKVPQYWEILDELAKQGIVFCPDQVKREIDKNDDTLKEWMSKRPHFLREETEDVQQNVRKILAKYPNLIAVGSNRSMADPWVIAHAMAENAIVVSKEYVIDPNQKMNRAKIPDVCQDPDFQVTCISDFQFVDEIGIKFNANI